MKKKLLSFALAAICLSVGACADGGREQADSGTSGTEPSAPFSSAQKDSETPATDPASDFTYKSPDGAPDEITIVKYHGQSVDVVVPAEIDGKPVTAIGASAFALSSVSSVTLPDSVTDIGPAAFCNCSALRRVETGNAVVTIGEKAFSGCRKLTDLILPDSLASIGTYAFFNCSALTALTLPDGITSLGDSAFNCCNHLVISYKGNTYDYIQSFALADEINKEDKQ